MAIKKNDPDKVPDDPRDIWKGGFEYDPANLEFIEMARKNKQIYDAHLQAGFSENQAIELTSVTVSGLWGMQAIRASLGEI